MLTDCEVFQNCIGIAYRLKAVSVFCRLQVSKKVTYLHAVKTIRNHAKIVTQGTGIPEVFE